jgi:hypothetical protein
MLPLILAAAGIRELLGRLGHDLVAVVVEPVDQRTDRGIFLILHQRGVVVGPEQVAAFLEAREQLAVVDVEAERARGCIKIRAVDEESNLFTRIEHAEISFIPMLVR